MPKKIPSQRADDLLLQGKVSTAQDTLTTVGRARSCCFYFQVEKDPQVAVTTPSA